MKAFALSQTVVPSRSTSLRSAQHWSRVEAIDMARGTAMLFVCLAHFSGAYLAPHSIAYSELFAIVSMIASPSFMIISGMTAGFLVAMYPSALSHLQRRLLDRGVFLLLVGHLLLALSQASRSGGLEAAYQHSFITDPIAIAIIVGPRLIGASRAATRVLLSAVLFVTGWALVLFWHPLSDLAVTVKFFVAGGVGPNASGIGWISFPLLEWIAVYLLGTVLGEHLGRLFRRASELAHLPVLRVGLAASIAGAWLYVSAKELVRFRLVHGGVATSLHLTSPTQKFPPGPAYLLFFGGCGLILMSLVLHLEAERRFPVLLQFLQRFGQASLVVYIVQAFVYGSVVRVIPFTPWWPPVFVGTIAFLGALAIIWCRIDGNRFLTVGLMTLLERRAQQRKLSVGAGAMQTSP